MLKYWKLVLGGGYNTLPLFTWEVKHVDILEPNLVGRNDMYQLFETYHISEEKYKIFTEKIEEYQVSKKYDIIIAEGFVQHLDNCFEVLEYMKKFTHENSIIIITCSDEIGYYVERMKRLVGQLLVKDIQEYDLKVRKLVDIFTPQLKKLKGMSRLPEDWAQDQLLNEASICEHLLDMKEAIQYYEDEFDILGSSQNIFVDLSWYKNICFNYKNEYKKQYDQKKHLFLFADTYEESIVSESRGDELEKSIKSVNTIARLIETTNDWSLIKDLILQLRSMNNLMENNKQLVLFNQDLEKILLSNKPEKLDLNEYKIFFESFGKSAQYISFSKI